MVQRKWLKRFLWVFAGLCVAGVLSLGALLWLFSPPLAFITVENISGDSVEVVGLSYQGKMLARDLVLESGQTSEIVCTRASWRPRIVLEVKRHSKEKKVTNEFDINERLFKQCLFNITIDEWDENIDDCVFFEGIYLEECVPNHY